MSLSVELLDQESVSPDENRLFLKEQIKDFQSWR